MGDLTDNYKTKVEDFVLEVKIKIKIEFNLI